MDEYCYEQHSGSPGLGRRKGVRQPLGDVGNLALKREQPSTAQKRAPIEQDKVGCRDRLPVVEDSSELREEARNFLRVLKSAHPAQELPRTTHCSSWPVCRVPDSDVDDEDASQTDSPLHPGYLLLW